ncbi:hypothetical protein D9623_33880 (plasmid) [Azospirillum brasilense]|nr:MULTISPECIES: hypothetical protein [Azospirillum]MDW7555433.1 hypothetical protein [Azospirillum brasilense]MDW7595159.1 hypothetical protein [Azospirillum brasilense]MDW7630312.1 hypothetical protein [Azospirillum brasilense]MDX5949680.1 hypothetical protein [Azospirillum brasilense]QCO12895.1 hypothetical protein D3868_28210 [Azospirillum brasilense]
MTDNLRHWDPLYKTDPAHTKQFTRTGGFRGTAIKPIYATQKMTEHFGPVGIGWGMTKPEYLIQSAGSEIAIYCTVGLWYLDNGVKSEVVWGVGGDIIAKSRNDGKLSLDDEAAKKSYTDALGNAMKQLGVGGDVHMGQFDDLKYRQDVEREFAEKRQDEKPDPKAIVAEMTKALRGAKDREHLDGLWDAVKTDFGKIGKAEQDAVAAVFDQEAARVLTDEFGRCGSLDALRDLWSAAQGYMHPMTADQKAAVTDAKDRRKRALMASVPSQAAE